jgi:hypothetical protein
MKLNCFLICDDIRNEVGNKHSLIGVYDDTINFSVAPSEINKWPKVMKLGVYIKAEFENEQEKTSVQRIGLEYSLNSETVVLVDGQINLQAQPNMKGINIGSVINQFVIKSPGNLVFKCILYNKENNVISSFSKNIMAQEQMVNPSTL